MERLLVTDLDGTFIGDDEATKRVWDALDDAEIGLAFATGRHLSSVRDFLRSVGGRRHPVASICMVGTEIWMRTRFGYRGDRGWSEVIGAHWDRAGVLSAARVVPGLTLQDEEWQSVHKISWFVDGDDPEGRVALFDRVLAERGVRALLVHSGGHLLDAIPAESGKGSATAFLARRLGLGPDAVITAGDSGNDLDMMRSELGFRSIVVGNADAEMRSIEADHVYMADAPYAAGIFEGLHRWGWVE